MIFIVIYLDQCTFEKFKISKKQKMLSKFTEL